MNPLRVIGGASLLALLLGGLPVVAADDAPSHVMVTQGIVGGFVPPHVRLRALAVKTRAGYEIHQMTQAGRGMPQTFQKGTLTEAQYLGLFDSAKKLGVWELPVETPAGAEDIYLLDTSINLRLGKATWRNGGPEGCVHGQSKVKASAEQRGQFKKMVDEVLALAKKQATQPSDAETFQTALRMVDQQTPGPKKGNAPVIDQSR